MLDSSSTRSNRQQTSLPENLSVLIDAPTFRDPQGRLFSDGDRVLREVYPHHAINVLSWIQSPLAQEWMKTRRLVLTAVVASLPDNPLLLEHERIFFPSYPWEWTPGQWLSAGLLTLDLCGEALAAGYILKDATPLNILFSGAQPIFVDVLSFDQRDPKSPLWMAYAQFVRTFLLPLAAHVYLGWPLSASQQRRDGYEPADLAPWLSLAQQWCDPLRSLVTLPMLLERNSRLKQVRPSGPSQQVSADVATAVVRSTLRAARKRLLSLKPSARASRWSNYADTAAHYKSQEQTAKQDFVRRALAEIKPVHVLDVGANTGIYSRIAASCGADVVAWDSDVQASDLNWNKAHSAGLSILPLIVDFARPTPAVGWRNEECPSLLSRAQGRFDCVLMLGVLHHLLVSDQIPLPALLDQLAEITSRWAILEWIPKEDPKFEQLSRGRDELYAHLDEDYFVRSLSKRFAVRSCERLANGRTLRLVEKVP